MNRRAVEYGNATCSSTAAALRPAAIQINTIVYHDDGDTASECEGEQFLNGTSAQYVVSSSSSSSTRVFSAPPTIRPMMHDNKNL